MNYGQPKRCHPRQAQWKRHSRAVCRWGASGAYTDTNGDSLKTMQPRHEHWTHTPVLGTKCTCRTKCPHSSFLHVLPRWHHSVTVTPARLHTWVTCDPFKSTKPLHLFPTPSSVPRRWNHIRGTFGGARWRHAGQSAEKTALRALGVTTEGADGVEAVHRRMGERITQQENKAATAARNFVVMEDRIWQHSHHSSAKSYWCIFQWEIQANDSVPAALFCSSNSLHWKLDAPCSCKIATSHTESQTMH